MSAQVHRRVLIVNQEHAVRADRDVDIAAAAIPRLNTWHDLFRLSRRLRRKLRGDDIHNCRNQRITKAFPHASIDDSWANPPAKIKA